MSMGNWLTSEDPRDICLAVVNKAFDELAKGVVDALEERYPGEALEDEFERALQELSDHERRNIQSLLVRAWDVTAVSAYLWVRHESLGVGREDIRRIRDYRNDTHHRRRSDRHAPEKFLEPKARNEAFFAMIRVLEQLGRRAEADQLRLFRDELDRLDQRSGGSLWSARAKGSRTGGGVRRTKARYVERPGGSRSRRVLPKSSDDAGFAPTADQREAIDRIAAWFAGSDRAPFVLAGPAGSGKTTIINEVIRRLGLRSEEVSILAFTGKARDVLKSKMRHGYKGSTDTLAKFLWRFAPPAHDGEDMVFTKLGPKPFRPAVRLVIVDEASMVTKTEHAALTASYRVLYVGDPDQLPPVVESSDDDARVLDHPTYALQTVARQDADSPIAGVAQAARTNRQMEFCELSDQSFIYASEEADHVSQEMFEGMLRDYEVVLVSRNATRVRLNDLVRRLRGHERYPGDTVPKAGELLLVADNARWVFGPEGLRNGDRLVVDEYLGRIQIRQDDSAIEDFRVRCHREGETAAEAHDIVISSQMLAGEHIRGSKTVTRHVSGPRSQVVRCEWGYAMTVHRAQGSEWPSVLVIEDPRHDHRIPVNRWKYVAFSRAVDKLAVVRLARQSRLIFGLDDPVAGAAATDAAEPAPA